MGNMVVLLTERTPLDVLQEMALCESALYRLQALRSVATTNVSTLLECWEYELTTCAPSMLTT